MKTADLELLGGLARTGPSFDKKCLESAETESGSHSGSGETERVVLVLPGNWNWLSQPALLSFTDWPHARAQPSPLK